MRSLILPCCKGVKINLISVRLVSINAKNHAEGVKVAILNVISKFVISKFCYEGNVFLISIKTYENVN